MAENNKKISEKDRNWYLYHSVYCRNGDFNKRVNFIFSKWGLPLKVSRGGNIDSYLREFRKTHTEDSLRVFVKEVVKLLKDFDLGFHWFYPCLYFFLSEKKLPIPNHTFLVNDNQEECIKNKRITIELGPHTTREDIIDNWPQISKLQKVVWPNVKQQKISKKTIENYFIWAHDMVLKNKKADEKASMAKTEFVKKEKLIDSEIIISIWDELFPHEKDISARADKKRVQRLRQIRKRGG